jgi:surfactin synthase thioesterase subunit
VQNWYEKYMNYFDSTLKILPKTKPITFMGHSQGGAIATIAASVAYQRGYSVANIYTFGAPSAPCLGASQPHLFRSQRK